MGDCTQQIPLWFPVLFLCLVASLMFLTGLPPIGVVGFVALNTAMVGFSKEVMFRGIFFRALQERVSIWPAIILTSVAFGSVLSRLLGLRLVHGRGGR